MDGRKNSIRELEDKKRTDAAARSRLLEGLGEILIKRIGEEEPFPADGGNASNGNIPGGILAEYPCLSADDVSEALRYAAWVVGAREETIASA